MTVTIDSAFRADYKENRKVTYKIPSRTFGRFDIGYSDIFLQNMKKRVRFGSILADPG